MTLTVQFTPREEAWLAAQAEQQGVLPTEIIKMLVDEHLSDGGASAETDPNLALFAQWAQEDANKTSEEVTVEDHIWQEFEEGINATRQAQRMRQLQ